MTKYRLEYIWLDGYTPTPNLRGKTQIKEFASFPTLEQLPLWGFDGSSTLQAEGHSSVMAKGCGIAARLASVACGKMAVILPDSRSIPRHLASRPQQAMNSAPA